MIATTRLGLDTPQGTDAVSAGPADFSQSLGVLDNAAITTPGTLASRPSPTSVVTGYLYICTDAPAAFITVAVSGTNVWQFIPLNGSGEPAGTVKQYAGATVPADPDGIQRWHIADGSAISRTTYATLFTNLGTTWGVGDGSTTFNIPDLRGRSVVGAGSGSGLTTRALAASGGEEAHIILPGELAAHAHAITDPGHGHTVNDPGHAHLWSNGSPITTVGYPTANATAAPSVGQSDIDATGMESSFAHITLSGAATGITVNNNTGGGSGHNNMQPFTAVNHIVKIL
jgi:microcystin-dependent protein